MNDYQKDLQFKKLNAQKDVIEVKVLRNGTDQLVGNEELVVGDILLLDAGDKVPFMRPSHRTDLNMLNNSSLRCTSRLRHQSASLCMLPTIVMSQSCTILSSARFSGAYRQVTADGLYITGHGLVVDEASLTGESEPRRKNEERPFIRCGTQASSVYHEPAAIYSLLSEKDMCSLWINSNAPPSSQTLGNVDLSCLVHNVVDVFHEQPLRC